MPRTMGGKIGLIRSGTRTPTVLVRAVRKARAIVFDGSDDYHHRINDPALAIDEDCILVDDRDAQKLLEAKERSALLNAALAALTSEDREIFLRRYYYNQTAGQIAEALHMNPSTVRSRLLRGRQALRTELQKGDVQIEDLCAESV